MPCPHCSSSDTKRLSRTTVLGYPISRCHNCQRKFNERTGTPFNFLEYPTDIVLLVVRWRLRYRLTLRDLAEIFLERGLQFTHEAVREWEERFAPLSPRSYETDEEGRLGPPGTWTRLTSRWPANGAICIGPSTVTATWSIVC